MNALTIIYINPTEIKLPHTLYIYDKILLKVFDRFSSYLLQSVVYVEFKFAPYALQHSF